MKNIFLTYKKNTIVILVSTLFVALAVIVWSKAFAFKPRDTSFGHTCITESAVKEDHPAAQALRPPTVIGFL